MNQGIHQVKVASVEAQPNKGFERVAFFDEDGAPVEVGGGVPSGDFAALEARVAALEAAAQA